VLAHASHVGLQEYFQWKLINNSEIGDCKALLFSALGGLSAYYSFFCNEFPRCYTSTLQLLLNAGAPLDIGDSIHPLRRTRDKYGGKTYKVKVLDVLEFQARGSSLHSESIQEGSLHLAGWARLVVLPSIIDTVIIPTMNLQTQSASQLWDFLVVWLEFGAMPPVEIVCIPLESPGGKESI
jgi:hypothetical protein